ncbi:MAG: indolepyruvate ferredoxin oxidoreductase subunit alpha [Methanobrevibacter sp.]|jgi:indolepyruvate ferredoxin oxidoreductase alpha subunit|nr:indolepyruvate ferredoxin oxidoreductase subunit alpha [Candidatus Methanoflexus mossambicus]
MGLNELINGKKGEKLFLLGNEAAVRGAIESKVSIASTYPGTPSSEIGNVLSLIAKKIQMYFEFSVNEKVAMETAATAAISGLRSFVFMKHVGLNVASDSFVSTAYTGVNGGMIILVADDPSIFSSQNEQDTRHYSRLANLPTLEPSNPQEIKDMMVYGYELSEKFKIPVIVRTTTRVSHMRGVVELGRKLESKKDLNQKGELEEDKILEEHDKSKENNHLNEKIETSHWKKGFFEKKPEELVIVPAIAKKLHDKLVDKIKEIEAISNQSKLNKIYNLRNNPNNTHNKKYGIITSSSAFNYCYDIVVEDNLNIDILKIGFSYPFPKESVLTFIQNLDAVFIAEEVDPIMEKEILAVIGENNMNNIKVYGKLNNIFPMTLELTPDIVRASLNKILTEKNNNISINSSNIKNNENNNIINKKLSEDIEKLKNSLPNRPPTLCAGCGHRSAYFAVKKAAQQLDIDEKDLIFASDIGCYTLGVSPPYETADYLLSMGSSIGNGSGFSKATNQKVVSFIGDSTFFHSGIAPLINGIHNKSRFIVTILDNRITAMTGGQPNPGLPVDGMGDDAPEISIEKIAIASGSGFVKTVNPINLKKTIATYKEAFNYDGVSVIIAKHPCTLIKGQKRRRPMEIKEDKCNECLDCINLLACPAISIKNNKPFIDKNCQGCTTCSQMCPNKAIGVKKNK